METEDKFKNSPIHDKRAILEMMDKLQPKEMVKVVDYIQEQVKLFCQPAVSGRSEQLKCGKEQCTCYGLQDAQNCDKDCENPIW